MLDWNVNAYSLYLWGEACGQKRAHWVATNTNGTEQLLIFNKPHDPKRKNWRQTNANYIMEKYVKPYGTGG